RKVSRPQTRVPVPEKNFELIHARTGARANEKAPSAPLQEASGLGRQSMPWEEEQERLTEQARLSVASPEEVVRELKRVAQKPRHELMMGRDEAIEALLVDRND